MSDAEQLVMCSVACLLTYVVCQVDLHFPSSVHVLRSLAVWSTCYAKTENLNITIH